jgi:hypothetical protein
MNGRLSACGHCARTATLGLDYLGHEFAHISHIGSRIVVFEKTPAYRGLLLAGYT